MISYPSHIGLSVRSTTASVIVIPATTTPPPTTTPVSRSASLLPIYDIRVYLKCIAHQCNLPKITLLTISAFFVCEKFLERVPQKDDITSQKMQALSPSAYPHDA